MMTFIFGYLVPMFLMSSLFAYMLHKDKSVTYGDLVFILALTFTPILNALAVVCVIIAGLNYLWDEYADKPVFK